MKRLLKDPEIQHNIFVYSISGIIIAFFVLCILKINTILNLIADFFKVISPFIWGLAFAFILTKFANFLEEKPLKGIKGKLKRFISSFISIFCLMAVIAILVLILAPELGNSISKLSKIALNFSDNANNWIASLERQFNLPSNILNSLYGYTKELADNFAKILETSIPNIVNYTWGAVTSVVDFIIGFIVAIYMLLDRERISSHFKRFAKAFLSSKRYERFIEILNMSITNFYKFFEGKIVDSLIIGVLCFIAMRVMNLEFSILISVIVGVTNIIPFFGPFIGAIPSGIILLMTNPVSALYFAIMILVLQQLDGNVIGPKILGDSVGLSSLWIMFAILVGGAYFGFFGMLLGVPVLSVIYNLVNEAIDARLGKEEPLRLASEISEVKTTKAKKKSK